MNDTKTGAIAFGFALVPYAAVAWAYTYLMDGGSHGFWLALGFLVAVRTFFSIIETLGSVLAWRIFQRRRMIDTLLGVLRAHKFPPKEVDTDDFSNYRARILTDYAEKPDYMRAAKEFDTLAMLYERAGILPGMRYESAAEATFKQYIATLPRQ
jgi:hypothetical protein